MEQTIDIEQEQKPEKISASDIVAMAKAEEARTRALTTNMRSVKAKVKCGGSTLKLNALVASFRADAFRPISLAEAQRRRGHNPPSRQWRRKMERASGFGWKDKKITEQECYGQPITFV